MLIKYYKSPELSYTNRKRYNTLPVNADFQEEQKSVLLGDGANTSIKTSVSNICNYVTIDNTRWYVTSYVYLNGKQVQLNLQRDVIGEFGISGCVGKVERGYTDSFLKYRKELSLNEILKDRKYLIPDTNKYGNFSVNTHNNELWGILYFAKPTELNPETGEPYPEQVNINIPSFSPNYVNYPLLENGTKVFSNSISLVSQTFYLVYYTINGDDREYYNRGYKVKISYNYSGSWIYSVEASIDKITTYNKSGFNLYLDKLPVDDNAGLDLARAFAGNVANITLQSTVSGLSFPKLPDIRFEEYNYTGQVVKDGNLFYSYTSTEENEDIYGNTNYEQFEAFIIASFKDTSVETLTLGQSTTYVIKDVTYVSGEIVGGSSYYNFSLLSRIQVSVKTYSRELLSAEESGNIVIDTTQQLVDEPYSILAFPLFDCEISSDTMGNFKIQRSIAFMVFNTVIQYLSGENPYLIDAQIYPYCPVLTGIASQLITPQKEGYPFFKIAGNTYTHICNIQLLPNSDIKKEYIERTYSIISPEQSGKFDFNFYDYVNEIDDKNGVNYSFMQVKVKTALKPFGIVSSAVITPTLNSLIGITYYSDLRGSQPTSNGFECSLASNAFETYKRQNSNYQQIFALQKKELEKQHSTELVNDITSSVVNTTTATAMGAISGASLADAGIASWFGTKTAGATAGASIAGGTVGAAMAYQTYKNEELREYERNLQQQTFDLQIGTIKNLPNSINRISSFNEILLQDFWYIIEIYECSDAEKELVDNFIERYSYGIGVFGIIENFYKSGWFLRSTLISSNYNVNLHQIAEKELLGGIYIYE